MMNKERFLKKMQDEVLDMEDDISMETKLEGLDEWDSLAFVSFIAMANTSFDKKVNRDAVHNAKTINDLYMLLQ